MEIVEIVWSIAATNIRRRCGGVSAKCEERGMVDARRLELGTTAERDGRVRLVFAGCALRRLVE